MPHFFAKKILAVINWFPLRDFHWLSANAPCDRLVVCKKKQRRHNVTSLRILCRFMADAENPRSQRNQKLIVLPGITGRIASIYIREL